MRHDRGDDDEEHQGRGRHRRQAETRRDSLARFAAGRPGLDQRRQNERDGDQPDEGVDERTWLHIGRRLGAEEQTQIDGQERHLGNQQHRCRGQEQPGIRSTQMSEGHDIVDAGTEQHHQHAETDQGIGRQELHQAQDKQRHGDEVHGQQGAHEPQFLKRPAEGGDGHLQEGDEQHQGQRRIDRRFQHRRARDHEPNGRRDDHGGEIDPDLSGFEAVAKFRRVHPGS